MKKRHKIIIGVVLLLLVVYINWKLIGFLPGTVLAYVESMATALGVLMVILELNESKNLSEGTFVTELSENFNSNKSIQRIYRKLELGETITKDDTIDIVAYLTYFETIYVLLKKRAIDISLIDDLFAYRFRLALNNPMIRTISLVRYDYAYVNLYRLEKKWCAYRHKDSVLKAHNPNYSIVVRGNKIGKNDILFCLATPEDAQRIHKNMQRVYDLLEDKSLYVCDDLEYVQNQINGGGFAVAAKNRAGEIVGSFVFRYPGEQTDNLGREIGLQEDDLQRVVHMESAVVLPEYRGRDLQLKMLKYAEEIIDKTYYHYFLATVSPNNPASYRSFEKNGYQLITTKEKYNGLIRRIYCKKV